MTADQQAIDKPPFPFGVRPDVPVDEGTEDKRGPDTINRLLLHGARYHDREALFLRWEQGRKGWGWEAHPDWRTDRNAIRAALVLRQRIGMEAGEHAALWTPFGMEFATVERGIWSIGGLSVPIAPDWRVDQVATALHESTPTVLFAPDLESLRELESIGGLPDSVKASVLLSGNAEDLGEEALSYKQFMDYGGILDTAERASMWRTTVRSIPPGTPVSLEYGWQDGLKPLGAISQAGLVEAVDAVLRLLPPEQGRLQILAGDRPDPVSRALLYAAWADGLTRTAFVRSQAAVDHAAELEPNLVAGPAEILARVVEKLQEPGGTSSRTFVVCVTDRPAKAEDGFAFRRPVSFLHANQIDVPLNEFPGETL
jgi:hypothetical protein